MPDLIELPPPKRPVPPQLVGHAFDSASALRAVERRRALKAQRNAIASLPTLSHDATPDDFHAQRLMRVRQQLEKLDAMIADEDDAQKLDRLASAQAKLSEQERILAGRPLPGSLKPGSASRAGRMSAWQVEAKPLGIAPGPAQTPQAPSPSSLPSPTGSVPMPEPPLPLP